MCNRNGQCVLDSTEVSCNCNPWFAGKNCQINLKLLLIVGAVSVCLMMIIACGVSCFCCRDRRKKPIPGNISIMIPTNIIIIFPSALWSEHGQTASQCSPQHDDGPQWNCQVSDVRTKQTAGM